MQRAWLRVLGYFAVLQGIDAYVTDWFFFLGGGEKELNPIVTYLMNEYGIFALVFYKVFLTGLMVIYLVRYESPQYRYYAFCIVSTLLIVSNIHGVMYVYYFHPF